MNNKDIKSGDIVKLIKLHKDDRPTAVKSVNNETVILYESRGGYLTWNIFDIGKIEK